MRVTRSRPSRAVFVSTTAHAAGPTVFWATTLAVMSAPSSALRVHVAPMTSGKYEEDGAGLSWQPAATTSIRMRTILTTPSRAPAGPRAAGAAAPAAGGG